MKKQIKKLTSIFLAVCIFASAVYAGAVSAGASTADEPAGAESGVFKYSIVNNNEAHIFGYTGEYSKDTDIIIPRIIDGYMVKGISEKAFYGIQANRVFIPDTVTFIGNYAFNGHIKALHLSKSLVIMGYMAFGNIAEIYIPKGIKVIPNSNFDAIYYEGGEDDLDELYALDPVVANSGSNPTNKYTFKARRKAHALYIYTDCDVNTCFGASSVVSDDFTLKLTAESANTESGEIPLEAGTYEFKIKRDDYFNALKGNNIYGYDKTINDSTSGSLTMAAKYKSSVKLAASGGVYKFTFNHSTCRLTVKRLGNLPEMYMVGDAHAVFKPLPGTRYYSASFYHTTNGGIRVYFNVSKNGTLYGWNEGSPYLGTELSADYKNSFSLLSGNHHGTANTYYYDPETNIIYSTDTDDLLGDHLFRDGLQTGGYNLTRLGQLVLDEGPEIDTVTAEIKAGNYPLKFLCAEGQFGGNFVIKDNGSKVLKTSYRNNMIFVASGGTYKFTFNKKTGEMTIKKLKE